MGKGMKWLYLHLLLRIVSCFSADDVSVTVQSQRDFTEHQLEKYNGLDKDSVYVSIEGVVYDVSSDSRFHESKSLSQYAGKTIEFHSVEPTANFLLHDIEKYPRVGKVSSPERSRSFTREELAQYSGSISQIVRDDKVHPEILVAIDGSVYDVSYGGYDLYGPEGHYNVFAGKDVSRALAKMSFSEDDINSSEIADLTAEQKESLLTWKGVFSDKYPRVGHLVSA